MTPTPVTVVPVMAPTHLLGRKPGDFVFGGNGGAGIFVRRRPFISGKRLRQKRCSLRTRSERRGTSGKSNSEFQKVAALHDISSFIVASDARRV
jgi:hypothetical protein